MVAKAAEEGRGPDRAIREHLAPLAELPGGYDFALAVEGYWRGHDSGDEHLKAQALRWLRGEFTSKADARAALGVRTIISDGNWYDSLKLLARLCRLGGHDGLVVLLDEVAVLHRIANPQARDANYQRILGIWNDTLQGGQTVWGSPSGSPRRPSWTPAGDGTPIPPLAPAWPRTPSPGTGSSTTRGP